MSIQKNTLLLLFVFFHVALWAVVPSGYYYFARNKSGANLKTALHQHSFPLKVLDYGGGVGFTWEGFYYTDRLSDGTIIDMYSPVKRNTTDFNAVAEMHIEHSLPKSWWGAHENNAYKDLFHLYPADGVTNSTKNNLPLGEVTGVPALDNTVSKIGKNGFGTDYSESCFEPADEYKGDFARSYFYVSAIYENLAPLWNSPMMDNNTYPVWKSWAIDLLLKWHRQDPVSDKELARIEAVYKIQGNRNPFIDYPALVEYIWGNNIDQVFPFPEETSAFLLTPRSGENIDFDVILQTDNRTRTLNLQGVNINSEISIELKNNTAGFSLNKSKVSAEDAVNATEIQITFTPTVAGTLRDTLIISGGGLAETLQIPVKALATPNFITLEPTEITPVGAKLQWISDPQASAYQLKVYQPDQAAGDLFISSYVEGSSWNKALEIYNGTGKTINLSGYSLRKQSNGQGSFGSTLKLTGTLPNNSTYLISHKSAGNEILLTKAALLTDTLLQINGNDAIELVRNGVPIDRVGAANAGADVYWGVDLTLQRKNTITHPRTIYNSDEWNVLPIDSVAFLGTHSIAFLTSEPIVVFNETVPAVNSYSINGLSPGAIYTYSVKSVRAGETVDAINTMQIHTASLEKPVVMKAYDISSTGFTANWEEDLYSNDFLLDVFKLSGSADTTVTEGFNGLGSTGTPLPEGWSGKITGFYDTSSSSGFSIPSAGLKTNNDWLQTKMYEAPVTRFTFMYRFPSAATGSYFLLDALKNNEWVRADSLPYKGTLAKTYPVYNFSRTENVKAFRFSYKKSSGNLAIDDVEATYGNQDTVFVFQNKAVTGNNYEVTGLNPANLYFYRVRTKLNSAFSAYSETMDVNTLVATKLVSQLNNEIRITQIQNCIQISGLATHDLVNVYAVTGSSVYQSVVSGSAVSVVLPQQGIYIISIRNGLKNIVRKIVL